MERLLIICTIVSGISSVVHLIELVARNILKKSFIAGKYLRLNNILKFSPPIFVVLLFLYILLPDPAPDICAQSDKVIKLKSVDGIGLITILDENKLVFFDSGGDLFMWEGPLELFDSSKSRIFTWKLKGKLIKAKRFNNSSIDLKNIMDDSDSFIIHRNFEDVQYEWNCTNDFVCISKGEAGQYNSKLIRANSHATLSNDNSLVYYNDKTKKPFRRNDVLFFNLNQAGELVWTSGSYNWSCKK